MLGGFGSGEALIDAVRDGDDDHQGAADARLALIEAEFGRMLKIAGRDGSTVSQIIRHAWDGARMETRSRAGVVVASRHHVAAVGQVTADELRARLTDTETYGGTANRFLFAHVARARLRPEGGNVPLEVIRAHAHVITKRVTDARHHAAAIGRTTDGAAAWDDLYRRLASDDPGGLLSALIGRDAPQCLRLSLLYALLDGAEAVDAVHVAAAEAVWCYCRSSAAAIFGDALGDPIADRLLTALRGAGDGGLDRAGQAAALGKHVTAARLDTAAERLTAAGLARQVTEHTAGRPRHLLVPATAEKAEQAKKGPPSSASSASSAPADTRRDHQ